MHQSTQYNTYIWINQHSINKFLNDKWNLILYIYEFWNYIYIRLLKLYIYEFWIDINMNHKMIHIYMNLKKWYIYIWYGFNLLSIGVWSVGGRPDITVIKNTVMFSIVEIPKVIFSPDSAGIRNTNLDRNTYT